MNIKDQIESNRVSRETLYVTECYYETTTEGSRYKRPLIHMCGQSPTGEYRHVTVDGFLPYFFIREDEYEERKNEIEIQMNKAEPPILDVEHGHKGLTEGGTTDLVKLVCRVPQDVKNTHTWFDETWEADVFFHNRFLNDVNVYDKFTIPSGAKTVTPEDITAVDSDGFEPRICTFDIEVFVDNDGFPDVTIADKPVTAITSHDSLTEEMWTGILAHPKWERDDLTRRNVMEVYGEYFPDENGTVEIFDSGRDDELLYEWIEWVRAHHPTVMMAWNISFDIPYVVNRALNEGCNNINKLSPTEWVNRVENPQWDTKRSIKGVQIVDAIEAFEKTTIHELKSSKLDDVAEELLGEGKEDIDDIDGGWVHDPEFFTRYNVRDVTATVGIIEECGAMDLYSNIQSLVGVMMEDIGSNKRVIDQAVLREALNA